MFEIRSRVFLFVALAFLGGCSGLQKPKNAEKSQYLLEIGTSYLLNQKYALALTNLVEAKRLAPNNPVVYNNLGLTYFQMQKHDLAYVEFKGALKLNSNYTDARNNLGGLLIAVGKYPQAIEELERASSDLTYVKMEKVYNNLGLAHFRSKNFVQAKAAFLKAMQYQDRNCQSNYYLGRSLYNLNDYATATESLDRAVSMCSQNYKDGAFFYSGMSHMKLGKNDLAQGRFREVVNLYPDSAYAKKAQQLLEILK